MNRPAAAPPEADPLSILADPSAPLAQIMGAVAAAETLGGQPATAHIGISAGATVDLLGLYLRRHALLSGVRLKVSQGNFDDPLGDLARFADQGVDHVLLAPFADTLEPAFEARAAMLSDDEVGAREAELRARWRLVLQGATGFRTVFLCGLHRIGAPTAGGDRLDAVLSRLNQALCDEAAAFANVRWIDMEAMVGALGRKTALDLRFYLRNAAPYSPAFLDEWARQLSAASRAYGTRFLKALVLDCDNTLWGGVLGEDLASGIKLSPHDYPGNIFYRAQTEFLALQRQGVLLCLCSKNDAAEVDALLDSHPDMVLRQADIVAKQVNWTDKVSNLRQIAKDLNIGLDSLVFLDDSAFECEAVRSQLPEVTVFQAPASPPDYLGVIAAIKDLFLAGGAMTDGTEKTEQYRTRAQALAEQQAFETQEEYLASLGLTVTLARDDTTRVARISELSQKSNQFNLTTIRYTPADIARLMADPAAAVWSLEVADKFGAAGLTGVVVVRREGETASVESLFMSCRVLGRGIEFAIWPTIFADAHGCTRIEAAYRPTEKNGQAADFYDRLGLPLAGEADGARTYAADLAAFAPPPSSWIKVLHD